MDNLHIYQQKLDLSYLNAEFLEGTGKSKGEIS